MMNNQLLVRVMQISAVTALAVAMAACQTTNEGGSAVSTAPSQIEYGLFNDQSDHLEELLAERRFVDGAKLYADHQKYFFENNNDVLPLLKKLAAGLNAEWKSRFTSDGESLKAVVVPSPQGQWHVIKRQLKRARDTANEYKAVSILSEQRFRSPNATALETSIGDLEASLRNAAPTAFAEFNHFGPESFF